MPPGEHFVEQNAQGIDIRPGVRLGKTVLLRGGIAGGPHDAGIGGHLGFIGAGRVKIDEDGVAPPEKDVFRLDVPVNDAQAVERLQRAADLDADAPGILRRQRAGLQKEGQGIALDVFFQHQHLAVPFRDGFDAGQVRGGKADHGGIGASVALKPAADAALAGVAVPQEKDRSPLALLQHGFGFILPGNPCFQIAVNEIPLLSYAGSLLFLAK